MSISSFTSDDNVTLVSNMHSNMEVTLREVEIDSDNLASEPDLSPGTYLQFSVSDTGRGMDREVLDKIFQPYFTTKSPNEGTGMGLAVVHGIVKSHEGKIMVSSEPDVGTTFTVYLPRVNTVSDEPKALSPDPIPKGTESVLLVDDEAQIIRMIKEMLESLGYNVTARTSSLDALEAFCVHPNKFDLVITDQTMPNMAGTDLARKFMGIRPDIPIILFTGFSEKISEDIAKAMGIRSFIMKPILLHDLGRTVRKVLDEKQACH